MEAGLRRGPLDLPNMRALGLGLACEASTGRMPPNLAPREALRGVWGYGVETSKGKDTPSGHWEIAGAPVDFDWGYFPETIPAFPQSLTDAMIAEGGLPGILGDRHASGTAIIEDFGEELWRYCVDAHKEKTWTSEREKYGRERSCSCIVRCD